jgi:UDP-N-acetyl-2-amino-2-deoxyglucuronate dehydrogenase
VNLRFGIVGCGVIHGTHADAIGAIEGAKLAAVCDVLPERSKASGDKWGVRHFRSLEAMLPHVDAVSICVPSGLHARLGVRAADAGKHVLCEKPVDVTLAAAKRLVAACRRNRVTLSVISQHRFAQDMRAVRDAAQSGEFGPLLMGDAFIKWYRTQAYYDSGAWRGTKKLDGGGCLMNQGVHYVDMIQWIMGGVRSVQAQTRTFAHDIEVEDAAYAMVEYSNGAIGAIHGATSAYPGFTERLEVYGKHGSAIIEGDRLKFCKCDPDADRDTSPYGGGVMRQPTPSIAMMNAAGEDESTGASADPTALWTEQHRLQIEDFVRAVQDRREPFITGEMALEPLKVILAVYRSAQSGGRRVGIESLG